MSRENIEKLAKRIDHTNLKADSTKNDIKKLCEEAIEYNFGAVCVNPIYVKLANDILKGTEVDVCTVVGFPLGATPPEVKAFETKQAIEEGAEEIDMVINVGALRSGDYNLVKQDIQAVVKAAIGKVSKVILETCYLTDGEISRACKIAKEAGADYVKTSTGFGTAGATIEHIKLMRKTVGPDMGIKASGGIRNYETAKAMIEAGATKIGASSSITIIEEAKKN